MCVCVCVCVCKLNLYHEKIVEDDAGFLAAKLFEMTR